MNVEMRYGGEICGHPNLRFIYERKIFGYHGRNLLNFVSNDPILRQMHYIQILELRALRKSSTRSSDHLNLEFESVPAAATCSLVLLANLFFIEFFSIRICYYVVVCLSIYACASSSIDRAE